MKRKNATRSALFTSIISLLLCMSMLVGTTFAWFTDEVKSGTNVIAAGNLDVELFYSKTKDFSDEKKVDNATLLFTDKDGNEIKNWEPGVVAYTNLQVANVGTLALTYRMSLNFGNMNTVTYDGVQYDLSDVLEVAIVEEGFADDRAAAHALTNFVELESFHLEGELEGNTKTETFGVVIYWRPGTNEHDNIFNMNNGKTTSDGEPLRVELGINLFATQEEYENDSFGPDYDNFDMWDGTADTTWYNDTDTEFTLTTAEQLAGFAELVDGGNNFAGKTVKLGANLDLYHLAEGATDPTCFDPIGSYRNDQIFEGTLDGQGHSISNMSQNTWALNNGYYYGDLGMGLFAAVENATIKNLVMDNASISGESGLCGTIAAVAGDNVTFENITVKNSEVADYQYYAGGIVGWAGGDEQFINCNVDASTTIGAQWGEFNNANGGIIGGIDTSAKILMKDCTVACRIDGFNDVTSAYEWYSYRRSGMLIGDSGQKDDPDGDNVGNAIAPNLTCENVTVIYGDWANYHYCQFKNMRYPWVRVEAGTSTGAYSNPRYGNPTDANGNTVVDENHVHNDGEKHNELIVFDQLYGGATGDRYCTYGTATHDGVTVIYNNK